MAKITVVRITFGMDALDQPEQVSLDEQYPNGNNVHDFADESLWGADPYLQLLAKEQEHETI